MVEKEEFVKIYLISAIVIGVIGLLDNILTIFDIGGDIQTILTSILFFIFFFVNILMIPIIFIFLDYFHKHFLKIKLYYNNKLATLTHLLISIIIKLVNIRKGILEMTEKAKSF